MYKMDLEKAEEPEIKLPTSAGSQKAKQFQKNIYFCFTDYKKIRDTRGTFHARMGTIKDRSGMELTEAEDVKKRWQEYTEELYKKKIFMIQITMMV